MKLGWGLLTQPDKLWVQIFILKGKYVKDKGHPPVVITKPNASPLYKSMAFGSSRMQMGYR